MPHAKGFTIIHLKKKLSLHFVAAKKNGSRKIAAILTIY